MEDAFGGALLRLKEQTGLHTDKDVAELLGMTVKAFSARKTRGVFPEDKLFSLVARRPDLKVDATYVLTGERVGPQERAALDAMYATTAKVVGEIQEGAEMPSLVVSAGRAGRDQAQIHRKRQQLVDMLVRLDESGLDLLIKVAEHWNETT
jgi:hypothetical protein